VATLLAPKLAAPAVVCLGYPFRFPDRPLDPARFAHLEHIEVPTLIIQGDDDEYGARNIAADYALSPAIRLELVEGDHSHHFSDEAWDVLASRAADFISSALASRKVSRPGR
jgi:predicted alpha/beta-hydrolase family hydrolase